MTYLITGATGDIGAQVVEQLIERGERPHVFVRDAKKARARFGDQVDIVTGDLADSVSLHAAFKGSDAVFLVNSGPQIPIRDKAAAAAARATGVQHLVKLSSLDVEQSLAIGAWHELGEAAIREAEVPFTFLRPTGFMSNLLHWAHSIKAEGIVRSSAGNGRRAFIHSADIAAVAVKILTERSHIGEALPITGPQALTFAEATQAISVAIQRSLRFEAISDEEAAKRFAATGAPQEEVEAHTELWRAIREGRLATVTKNVRNLLGRNPIPLSQWVEENKAAFQ